MSVVQGRLDLIDAVVYADMFDCTVTLDKAWRYSLVRVTPDELRERFAKPALWNMVAERDGSYFLTGREEPAGRRDARRRPAALLRQRVRRVARWLQYAPFMRGILLTGSVAADGAGEEADVDMLVIVAPRRLAFTRRDHYVAREVAQADALAGRAEDLLAANGRVGGLRPNLAPLRAAVKPFVAGQVLQRLLELPFRGRLGDGCDRRARPRARAPRCPPRGIRWCAARDGSGTIRSRRRAALPWRAAGRPVRRTLPGAARRPGPPDGRPTVAVTT